MVMAGKPAYSSGRYKRFVVQGRRCTWCGNMATTRDHEPALALHAHVEGSGCCVLVPACRPCNSAHGRLVQEALKQARQAERSKRTGVLATRAEQVDVY